MDTNTVTSGSETSAPTEKTNTESTGQEQVEFQGSQEQTDTAGGSQETPEGGKDQGTDTRRPFRSKNQTIYELRQGLRERERQIQELNERFSQFEQKFQPRGQERKPSRTFWEAPEEVLDERITGHLSEMEKRLLERMEQRDTQSQQTAEWKQETSEAAKLIQSYKGITDDDILEIQDIVKSQPIMESLRPKERAEYALFMWEKQKGIGNRTVLKNKAASFQGAPPAIGQKKQWTKSEMDAEMKTLPVDPRKWSAEDEKRYQALDTEFREAIRDNRVR